MSHNIHTLLIESVVVLLLLLQSVSGIVTYTESTGFHSSSELAKTRLYYLGHGDKSSFWIVHKNYGMGLPSQYLPRFYLVVLEWNFKDSCSISWHDVSILNTRYIFANTTASSEKNLVVTKVFKSDLPKMTRFKGSQSVTHMVLLLLLLSLLLM